MSASGQDAQKSKPISKSWSRPTRYMMLILVLASFLWLIIAARDLFEALAISALLAYILNPVVTFFNRRARLSRNWTVFLVYLLSLAGLVTLGIIFVPVIPDQAARFVTQLQIILQDVQQQYLSEPIVFLTYEVSLLPLLPDVSLLTPEAIVRPDIILNAVQATSTNVGWLLVILVSTYYLLQDWDRLREWLLGWAPEGYGDDARRLYEEIKRVWNQYFRGQLRLSLIIGFLTGIGSAIVGLPGAVIFGIFAGIFDVLLSVGPFIVMTVAGLVALFGGSSYMDVPNLLFALIVVGIYSGIQIVENLWLRPRVMGHSLQIHPAIVFIAIIASLALAGILTALIIIPVIGSVAVIGRYLHRKIFDLEPWPDVAVVRVTNGRSHPAEETAVATKLDGA